MNILIDSQDCMECETSFCMRCITDWAAWAWLEKNNECPKGCKKLELKRSHWSIRNALDKLIISCICNPKCSKRVEYSKLEEHEKTCEFNVQKCPNWEKCWVMTNVSNLNIHVPMCNVFLKSEKCLKCGKMKLEDCFGGKDSRIHELYYC
jgi:hypothetical protein